jgi:tRNA1(Val) A37 N6-methylase TrmN6
MDLDWKNKPFICHYAQPPEYHYSLDSIELVWRLGLSLQNDTNRNNLRVLDLCCGCGVLGFDLHYWIPEKIAATDFIDVQCEYKKYFERNRELTGTVHKPFNFHCMNYKQIPQHPELRQAFQLILCNPPYFRSDSATLGQSEFRNRCHFLLDGSFFELCEALIFCLAPDGEAYILLKNLKAQGIDQLKELQEFAGQKFKAETIGIVRGTPVVRLRRRQLF